MWRVLGGIMVRGALGGSGCEKHVLPAGCHLPLPHAAAHTCQVVVEGRGPCVMGAPACSGLVTAVRLLQLEPNAAVRAPVQEGCSGSQLWLPSWARVARHWGPHHCLRAVSEALGLLFSGETEAQHRGGGTDLRRLRLLIGGS